MDLRRSTPGPQRRVAVTYLATLALTVSMLTIASPATALPITIDVTASPYSAAGDGITNDREAIQDALDAAGANPDGGTVVLPAGSTFLSGGLRIPSDVTLRIDGTLEQSLDPGDYAAPVPTPCKYTTSGIMYDQWMFHNDPFVYSVGTSNAAVTGSGTIEISWGGSECSSLYMMAIGFLNTEDFLIENVSIRGSRSYNVAAYGGHDGVIRNLDILTPSVFNSDGISIVNGQNILVEGNTIVNHDDGMYAVTRIVDPRDYNPDSWWTQRTLQPSRFVEFADNHVDANQGVPLRATIHGVSDLREVETTDIWVHDNYLRGRLIDPVGCYTTTEKGPMTRYRFENNTYVDDVAGSTIGRCTVTDFVNDFGAPSSPVMLNGDFESTGHAWWNLSGGARVVENDDPALPPAATAFTGFVGYLDGYSSGIAELVQGLGLDLPAIPGGGTPLPSAIAVSTRYDLTARVQTSGDAIRMLAYDACTGDVLAERTVSASTPTVVSLPVILNGATCTSVRVGFDSQGAASGWALVDDVTLEGSVIDDVAVDHVAYTGTWQTYSNTPSADVQGTRTIGFDIGDSVSLTFTGRRAWVYGVRSANSGIVTVSVDGGATTAVDAYSATTQQAQVLFDTGDLPWGDHEIDLTISGQNPAAANHLFGFDALLVDRIIDDTDSAVSYTGTWSLFTNSPTLDVEGTRHVGRTAGATATLSFEGSRARIYGSVGPTLGRFEVFLDGGTTPVATVDPYAPAIVQGIELWDSGPLPPGSHTLTIRVTGVAHPSSTGHLVGFDAVIVT